MTDTTSPLPESNRARRLATLRRRADHLQARVEAHPERTGMSYDQSELVALRWALRMLDEQPAPEGSAA